MNTNRVSITPQNETKTDRDIIFGLKRGTGRFAARQSVTRLVNVIVFPEQPYALPIAR